MIDNMGDGFILMQSGASAIMYIVIGPWAVLPASCAYVDLEQLSIGRSLLTSVFCQFASRSERRVQRPPPRVAQSMHLVQDGRPEGASFEVVQSAEHCAIVRGCRVYRTPSFNRSDWLASLRRTLSPRMWP